MTIASVPFHMWAPDVYEGAPTTVTAFMSAGVKAAAFGALLRVFDYGLAGLASHWQPLVASPFLAGEAILFYLVAYAAVNLGAFGVIAALAKDGREPATLADLAGLAERRPALSAALALFLVSLTGIPVTAGFVGKFYLFGAAVASGWVVLALVGVLTSVVSAYYYLRIVVAMYMEEPVGEDRWARVSPSAALALALSAGVTLLFGLWPAPVLRLARLASRSLF